MDYRVLRHVLRPLCALTILALTSSPARAEDDAPPPGEEPENTADGGASEEGTEKPAKPDDAALATADIPEAAHITLLAAGDIRGQLADVNCRKPASQQVESLHFARQAALYHRLVDEGREPLAVNVGDSIFPGAIPRFLLQSGATESSLAALLDSLPWDLHAFGRRELAIAVRELARFSAQASEAGLAIQSANMHCREGAADDAFCRKLRHGPDNPPYAIAERSGLKIGLIPILDPAAREFVSAERLELVEIRDPAEVLPDLVAELRGDRGVDLVVVVHHGYGDEGFERLHELVSRTPGIDVTVTSEAPGALEAATPAAPRGYTVSRATGTHIVGAASGHEAALVVDMNVERDTKGDRWRIRRFAPRAVATADLPEEPRTAELLRDAARDLCATWGGPISQDVSFDSPHSVDDFRAFVLGVMRTVSRSHVAVTNAASFRQPELFPLTGSLTFADVYTVLAFNNRLAVLELEGAQLALLAERLGSDVRALGLENRDGSVRVNGRAVIDDATYRVATNSFLASGGDGVLDDIEIASVTEFHPPWAERPPSISEIVIDFVAQARFPRHGDDTTTIDPEQNFSDLHRKPLWRFRAAIDGSYNQVSVRNPEADDGSTYGRPQLAVSPTSQINLEARGGIQADSRYHRWNNELLFQYAMARAEEAGELGPFRENKDVTRLRSQYRYNGIRYALGEPWYAPAPFAELQIETELRVPDDRDHRRLALTGIVGPELQLFEPLTVFAGFNARRDVTQPAGEYGYGLAAGYRLQRMSLFESLGNSAELESELELYLNRLGGEGEQELRSTSRLFFTIIGELSFTTTLSTFMYRRATPGDLGFNTSLTVGLNYSWHRAMQAL